MRVMQAMLQINEQNRRSATPERVLRHFRLIHFRMNVGQILFLRTEPPSPLPCPTVVDAAVGYSGASRVAAATAAGRLLALAEGRAGDVHTPHQLVSA